MDGDEAEASLQKASGRAPVVLHPTVHVGGDFQARRWFSITDDVGQEVYAELGAQGTYGSKDCLRRGPTSQGEGGVFTDGSANAEGSDIGPRARAEGPQPFDQLSPYLGYALLVA